MQMITYTIYTKHFTPFFSDDGCYDAVQFNTFVFF